MIDVMISQLSNIVVLILGSPAAPVDEASKESFAYVVQSISI